MGLQATEEHDYTGLGAVNLCYDLKLPIVYASMEVGRCVVY